MLDHDRFDGIRDPVNRFLDVDDRIPGDHPHPPLADFSEQQALGIVTRRLTGGAGHPPFDGRLEALSFPPGGIESGRVHGGLGCRGQRVVMDQPRGHIVLCERDRKVVDFLTGNHLVCYNSIPIYAERSL